MTKYYRLMMVVLTLTGCIVAQALPVRLYDVEQLSSNLFTCICQDQQGYVWIGTEYGLNKFDGAHVTQYYNDDSNDRSLSDNIVRGLLADSKGTVWVLTKSGAQRYNRMTDAFETILFGDSRTANLNDILETPDGKVWLLSAAQGVFEVDADGLHARPVETVNKHIDTRSKADNMLLDNKGRLWIGYWDAGLQMINIKTGESNNYQDQFHPDNRAVDIIEDGERRLTVLTYTGILRLNEQTRNLEPVVTFARNAVHHIYKDAQGQLFVGTTGSGLWQLDAASRQLTPFGGIPSVDMSIAKVHAFLQDREGNLWIGCFQRYLLLVSPKAAPFHYLPLNQMASDNGNVLRSLFTDSGNHLYVCQERGGITETDQQGRTQRHWMGNRTVMTMREDRQGQFWVGTYRNGLFRLDPQTGQERMMPLTANQRIGSITEDRAGNLYTAVFNDGLHSYTPDGETERVLGKGKLTLTNPYLNTLFTDHDGLIWIGHYYGIDVYDPETDRLVDVRVPAALRPAVVYAIGQSPSDHSVWIGSSKGLFQYYTQGGEKGQWKRFTTKEGLTNDIVCGLVITTDGTIWASTYRGLAQIDTKGNFTRYYRGNGLLDWAYLRGVYAYSPSGKIILGSQYGITWFMPKDIVKAEFKRGITLTGMLLGNAEVNSTTLSDDKQIVTKPFDMVDEITVSYYDNTFSLRFSSMDFRDVQNVHYEYRFEDDPKDVWQQTASGVSKIPFSHLSVGKHRLQVRAYDNGVYSPVKTLTLLVSPPWYRTSGAYAFYLALLLAIAALWWRSYWNKRQAEINEEKIKFFVDISHELRSPLTLIKSPLDKLLKTSHDPQVTRALRSMERNTNRLLILVNQILSIRKIEKGQMTLHFAETPFADFVSDICHDYDYQVEKRQLLLSFTNEAADMKVWIDRDNFDKVVANLLSNAIKYIEDGGRIEVFIRQTGDNHAELEVRDNGPGIDEAQLKKIFERFYQASAHPAAGQMSYGIGLNLTQKIVILHGGSIEAHNRTDERGSDFVVRLPLGTRHLPKEQLVSGDYYAPQATQEEQPSLITESERPRRVRKKTTYHVAVVDDDDEMRTFLQTELSESYHVHAYADGQKALEGIVDTVPDLVVSDVVMPKMDGFELLRRLKSSTTTSHIPVILLTTKTEHQSRVEGLEQGADAYIDKPFNLEELEARIAGLIANRIRMRGKFSGMQEQEETVRKIELKGNDAALMERIMKAVNARLDDSDFNVEALADEVGLSRVQLHRRMKELTGITVGEFIRNLRLQQAAKLLAAGDTTVSQVTYAVGFANPTHFSTAFKKHFGVTPSEYIAKHERKA